MSFGMYRQITWFDCDVVCNYRVDVRNIIRIVGSRIVTYDNSYLYLLTSKKRSKMESQATSRDLSSFTTGYHPDDDL